MGFDYQSLDKYTNKIDESRKKIIDICHSFHYIIPTDEMREEIGANHILFSDIKNWLYKRSTSMILCKTISTNTVYLDISLKQTVPDLEIQWDYDPINPEAGIEYIKDITDPVIKHTYTTKGIHTIALFSPSILDKVCSYAFVNNKNIKQIEISPVITTLDSSSFFRASNLDTLIFKNSNLKTICSQCLYATAIEDFTLPNSVETIYGSDTFFSQLTSFVIDYEHSKLKNLIGSWIFNFQDRATDNDWIDIPANCEFFIGGNLKVCYDNLRSVEQNWTPFSRNCNRIKIHYSTDVMNDEYGITYLKDDSNNPIVILNIPQYDIFDSYQIPNTVKYIGYGALMQINTTDRQIPITIPSTIEHISPGFIYWQYKNFKFTSENALYKATEYGGLMTYSDKSKIGSDPDVLLYEPKVTGDYSFPSNFSCNKDFDGQSVLWSSISNSSSYIENMKINKNFPIISNIGNTGPFTFNPRNSFSYLEESCDNYIIYENCLYMTRDNDRYRVLVGIPYNLSSFTIHPNCKYLYMSTFRNRSKLTGTLELINIIQIGYQCFAYTTGLNSIIFGNEIQTIGSYMAFNRSGISTLQIGLDKNNSVFSSLNGQLFGNNPNLTDIWIYSTIVSSVSKTIFSDKIGHNKTIHIYFKNTDGSETLTYQTFKNAGYSSTQMTEMNVILVDID